MYGNLDLEHFARNLFLCQSGVLGAEFSFNGPTWYISVNFVMYIIHYIICFYSKGRLNRVNYCYAFLFFFNYCVFTSRWNFPFLLNGKFATGGISFSLGALLANVYKQSRHLNTKLIGYFSLVLLGFLYYIFRTGMKLIGDYHIAFMFMGSSSVIFSVLFIPWLNWLFSTKFGLFLGSLSFPIYLIHFPIQLLFKVIDTRFQMKFDYTTPFMWMVVNGTITVTAVVYVLFLEEKMTRLFWWVISFLRSN